MIRDLLEEPLTGDIETDVCVIGAGAAGITIARRFEGSGVGVCLIESGGMQFSEPTQAMYEGETPDTYYGLHTTRLRFFGGTTNHWTGVCGLLDPIDFEPRPWVGSIGWPFSRDALMPYWERAHGVLDIGAFEYDPAVVGRAFPEFDPDKLEVRLLRFSPPTRFNQKYAGEIRASSNIQCLTSANVVDFATTHDASRVSAVRVAPLGGDERLVRARLFVLACGGLENPRLLLNASATPQGLGNRNGLVGRYFADHVQHRSTALVATRSDWWEVFGPSSDGDVRVSPTLCLGEAVQRREGLLNCRGGLGRADPVPGVRPEWTCLSIFGHCEQLPSAENRVELSDERDAMGLRKIRLHWSISEQERRTLERCVQIEAEEFGRLGLARVRLDARLDAGSELSRGLSRGSHHMCSTRMSADPATGVVDADCRVHGVDNLYIGGSSVFPCSGSMNPTLTLVALAIRLGDHLAGLLGVPDRGVSSPGGAGG